MVSLNIVVKPKNAKTGLMSLAATCLLAIGSTAFANLGKLMDSNTQFWQSFFDSLKNILSGAPKDIILNAFYIVFMLLVFWGFFTLTAIGIKGKPE